MSPRSTIWFIPLFLLFFVAGPAAAEDLRYALVVGVNEGDAGEVELHFAERDASRTAGVLTRLGGVPAENLILIRGAVASDVTRALRAIGRRIAQRRKPGDAALLFVYYSGHASAGVAHLRRTRLGFQALRDQIKATGADLQVVIMDACRSGDLTRVKGGVTTKPFEITVTDTLDSAGLAIISSSAAGEDAQESDRLRGGIFTHHLLNGLLGAADKSKNGAVTLSEAYEYAHTETVRSTSRTRFVQHPTYSFRLAGRRELVVTQLTADKTFGRLKLQTAGAYVVMEKSAGGRVVSEFSATGETEVLLQPGAYLVRRREPASIFEKRVRIARDKTTSVGAMKRLPYGVTVRKGLAEARSAVLGVTISGEVGGPLLDGLSVSGHAAIGLRLDLQAALLEARIRWGRATGSNANLELTQDLIGADLGVYKVFDLPRTPLGLGFGLRLGGDYVTQSFETRGSAPDRSQWLWRMGPVVRFEAALHPLVSLTIDGGADFFLGDFYDATTRTTDFGTRIVPFGTLGLVFYIP